ncbi:MerC domain-containing protein [Novosphingopyxis sp. YJ-S2-01]|uniref:MerC domain-containing protein n=1 Tax=Novosphingopyxis sp. YJ-S2-01 TaxID=2794021 RepID=UPI0018DD3045|nr:MerC domain-containing protein [Novosphingopyxis sp. YJ-S2-01]MBH9536324.1 MerC domain-containing protein [Novosphingopyxis sp. YJ-S2-01]|tara:strand:+ start:907 stop:1275 length:369 start_codon:yes stop_codon:yes gene_type:complete
MTTLLQREGFWDRAAMGLSGLCVVHCIATAAFVAAAASIGGILGAEWIHQAGLVIAMVLGAIGLGRGVLQHGYILPLAIGSLGLGVMAGALSMPHGGGEVISTILGVSILALGHDLNFRATH